MKYAADKDAFVSLMESEGYFKLIIATGMRRGECCGLK